MQRAYLGTDGRCVTVTAVAPDAAGARAARRCGPATATIDVLHGVDLARASRARSYALLGPNGAGKSTTLAVASRPDRRRTPGSLLCAAATSPASSADALARAGVCLIPEGRGIFPNLTVTENLRMATFTGTPFATCSDRAFAPVPPPAGAAQADRRHAVGRRAADALDGPRARHRPGACC